MRREISKGNKNWGASVIVLDIVFFMTQTRYNTFDVAVYNIFSYSTVNYLLQAYYMTFFGIDFFVYLATNSIFGDEIKVILGFKKIW